MSDNESRCTSAADADADIAAAYRHLAREIHPDARPAAAPGERRARESAMVRLNVAYQQARAGLRGAPSGTPNEQRAALAFAPTPSGICDVCGEMPSLRRHLQLQDPRLREHVVHALDLELCAHCAQILGAVPAPPGAVSGAQPPAPPVSPNPPRRGLAVAVVLSLAAGVAAVGLALGRPSPAPSLTVGACVTWTGAYSPVTCGDAHAGRIVSTAAHPAGCPSGGAFTRSGGEVLCIDTSK